MRYIILINQGIIAWFYLLNCNLLNYFPFIIIKIGLPCITCHIHISSKNFNYNNNKLCVHRNI